MQTIQEQREHQVKTNVMRCGRCARPMDDCEIEDDHQVTVACHGREWTTLVCRECWSWYGTDR